MIDKFLSAFSSIFTPRRFRILLALDYEGYLKEKDWFASVLNKESKINNDPIPWFTYPAIDFLSNRINKEQSILEFGCGNSTRWFALKAKSVISVEHNEDWFNKIKKDLPTNSKLLLNLIKNEEDYHKIIKSINQKFEIIVVDAIDRENCIKNSINLLEEKGVIILDNSDRKIYDSAKNHLIKSGFRKIDFWGMTPIILSKSCTSIFYRIDNCIGI